MKRLAVSLCVGLTLLVSGALHSDAQTTTVVHSFTGAATDGDAPNSLIEAQDGNYYGTTAFGGSAGSCTDNDGNTVGCGTVFKLSNGTVTVLYSFSGAADGGNPTGLIQGPNGHLYGTTAFGGLVSSSTTTNPNCGTAGCGVIFEINPSQPPAAGQLVPVYTFSGASDPTATPLPDGAYPNPLTLGAGGVFYGTSIPCSGCNKSSYGFLFSFTPGASSPFATMSTFGNVDKQENQSALDYPNAVIQTNATTLYGTTLLGGDTKGCLNTGSGWGCGGVFTYILSGTNAGLENDVCYFGQNNNVSSSSGSSVLSESTIAKPHFKPETIVVQSSGRFPANAAKTWTFDTAPMTIALGGDTNIYGASPAFCVTYAPGTGGPATLSYTPVCSGPSGLTYSFPATVFQCIPPTAPIANPSPTSLPTGVLNTVYSFTDSGDGGGSLQGLMLASNGDYYGTSGVYTFDLTPTQMATFTSAGTTLPLTSLSPFYSTLASDTTNFSPDAMIQGSDGNFYGTTATGGSTATSTLSGDGAIFEVSTSLKAPVQLSFTQSPIAVGGSSTLEWTVPEVYSVTSQQCYAFKEGANASTGGSWGGQPTSSISGGVLSGSTSIAPTAAGTYTYALTCGGIVSGFATLQVNAPQAATPTFSPTAGNYTSSQSVTISDTTPGATIYYTTNGTTPTTGSPAYGGPITVSSSETLEAIATASGYTASNVATAAYTITPPAATPTFSPVPGTYTSSQMVTISDTTPGATIYYTTNGTTPTTSSTKFTGPITVSSTETLEATATASGYTASAVATAAYTITPPAATPTFSLAAGTYTSAQSVTIADTTPGSTIYYTTNGTMPTTSSTVYSAPITVSSTETLEAIATASGYSTSAVAIALYTINIPSNPVPVISSLSPAFTSAGGSQFSLTITGSGFVSSSTVYWGTTALSTQYTSSTVLTVQVPAADFSSAGITPVTVKSPAPGGGTSNTFQFEVDSAGTGSTTPPNFTVATFTVVPGSTATYPVTLSSSATNVSVQCLNLPSGATCSYSAMTGALTISTSATTPAGTYQITAVFTETLPGAASAFALMPMFVLPLMIWPKRWTKNRIWLAACLVSVVIATALTGCGGGSTPTPPPPPQTHQVTISGTVSLTVQ